MSNEGLAFNELLHEYRWDGATVPSVTQILAPLNDFARVPFDVLEFARERGSAVHAAIALAQADDLDEDSLDPVIVPYVAGWRLFMEETRFVAEEWERPLYHPRYRYAGTFDAAGLLGKTRAVVDFKTGLEVPLSVGPQLAAYQQLINTERQGRNPVLARYACQLPGDGGYRLEQFTRPDDWVAFQSLLNLFRWRQFR